MSQSSWDIQKGKNTGQRKGNMLMYLFEGHTQRRIRLAGVFLHVPVLLEHYEVWTSVKKRMDMKWKVGIEEDAEGNTDYNVPGALEHFKKQADVQNRR
jgi:hypothetical protein